MRRRFGRGRKGASAAPKNLPIDQGRCFERIVDEKIVEASSLEPASIDGISESFAAVATGEDGNGGRLVVAFAPHHGGDAALAGLACAQSTADGDGFRGEVFAVCPEWSIAARRRLELISPPGFGFHAVAATSLSEGNPSIELQPSETSAWFPSGRVADRLEGTDRDLFSRALAALEGLAAKHRGSVRGVDGGVELVLLARRVARLTAEPNAIRLETILPEKSSERLEAEQLAAALDRLEGGLRKRLNDRRLRSSEEGLRARLWGPLAEIEKLRQPTLWPLPGSDPEVVDLVGVGEDGAPVVAALRSRLTLADLGAILDGVAALKPVLPAMFAQVAGPVCFGRERLILGAKEFDPATLALLPLLSLDSRCYDVLQRRGREPELALRGSAVAAARRASTPATPVPAAAESAEAGAAADGAESPARPTGRRPRRGRRSGSGSGARERSEPRSSGRSSASGETSAEGETTAARYDEVSIFDLDEGTESPSDGAGRRPRRGRRRSRRSRSSSGSSDSPSSESDAPVDEPPEAEQEPRSERGQPRDRSRRKPRAELEAAPAEDSGDDVEDEDLADALIPQVSDVEEPDVDVALRAAADVPDEDAALQADESSAPEPTAEVRKPRRRAAIVAHADRGSLIAALLLARDLRLLEGLWVYPQADLMTFFRSVATDLREETPIYLVGFTASPARDTIQAASLYSERITWFDHHDWPPEDLERLRDAVGATNVMVTPGAESPIPSVLAERTRRSRFSDKIVELSTGRFSQHDYERWGRVWWQRLGAIAAQSGDRRADIEPLLVGRPSDLAREAADVPTPPPPVEVEFVSSRDFRLVHFGGYRMVVVPTPPELDVHLAARVARERYDAPLSLGFTEGEEVVILAGDESRARRNLDLLSMGSHLVSKHEWIGALPVEDYVARIRIHDLVSKPDRLSDVIGEIAMGRSILEG